MNILGIILSALLFILKLIGIILLSILALAVLILCMVLFVPVRYKVSGNVNIDGKPENLSDTDVRAKISWLFSIISIKVSFCEKKLIYSGSLFGIKLVNSEKPKKEKAAKENKKEKKKAEKNKEQAGGKEDALEKDEGIVLIKKEEIEEIKAENTKETETAEETQKAQEEKEDEKPQETHKFGKLYAKFENIKFKFIKICDKIRNVNGTRESFVEFLSTEESRLCINEVKSRLLKMLLHILPRSFSSNIVYGLPDPAATGKIYGIIAVLLSRQRDKAEIIPQFEGVERPFIKGSFKFKGRIIAAVILFHAVMIYKNKRLKEFIAFAKGKGKRDGR